MRMNQPNSRRGRARVCRPLAEPLEDRKLLTSLLALSEANSLVRFESTNLALPATTFPITFPMGVGAGEEFRAIDVRPSNGLLYALTTSQTGPALSPQIVARVYVISLGATGATAQPIAANPAFLVNSEQIGIDFNPASDRLRVITGVSDLSIAINVDTGTLQYDPALNFAPGYTPAPLQPTPDVTAIAYNNNDNDPTTGTTLFGYEYNEDDLVTIAFASGVVTKRGDSGVAATPGSSALTGLDIEGASTTAFAALQLTPGGSNRLLSINLAGADAGVATDLGVIPMPGTSLVRDLAVAPVPRVQFEFASYVFDENVGAATGRIRRTGDLSGTGSVIFQTTTPGTATPGTATPGIDFTTTNTTLNFAAGEEFATFSVPITNDALAESLDETIGVTLTSPSTGSTLGSQSTATLTIRANDPDTTAPTVESVRPVIVGRRRSRRVESILVTFSEPIGTERAQNLANYEIRRAGFFRRSPFMSIPIRSASYNEATRTVTLIPATAIRIDRATLLVIRGTAPDGIADLAGNLLDGGDQTRRLS